ncbi:MAG: lactonase family protein [Spirochaetales bacterium]|nr:lactonase family protein [Spirochaetales bacterium]
MHTLILGSRVSSDTQGITFCSFDEQTGTIAYLTSFDGVEQPTFQCFDGERRILYTVSETEVDGHVHGYCVSPSLACEQILCIPSLGGSPCHLALAPSGAGLAIANYADGTFTYHGFEKPGYRETFSGTGKHPVRQERSHIHSSLWKADDGSLLVADLGLDRLVWYKHSFTSKQYIKVPPGTGPRHMALSSDMTTLFVAGELSSEVLVIKLGPVPGVVQIISTLPPDYSLENTAADIHLSSDGRFLYCSNRGHNSIAMYAVEPASGFLTLLGHCKVEEEPRNFALDPSGAYLLSGNASSNSVTVHAIDQRTGMLFSAVQRFNLLAPVCLTFMTLQEGRFRPS